MAEKLEIDISVKNNNLGKALDEGIKKASTLEDSLTLALGVFGGNLITKGFETIVGGFNSLIGVAENAIAASAAQEVATNNLNNALARQGNFSKKASENILAYADSMQQTTVFEDDAVVSSAALLQSLTKLNTDGLKAGVGAAADFATVLGVDLETATRLVAKAAEGNVEAFKRYGVEIKKGSTDSETFANTVKALNAQFGGASAAQLNTYAGSLKALDNSYGNLLESIGDVIVKNPIVIGLFNAIKEAINGANTEVANAVPAMQDLVKSGFIAISVSAQILLDILGAVTGAVKVLYGTFQNLSGLIGQVLIAPIELLIDSFIFLGSKIPGIGDAFEGLKNPLDGATEAMNKLASEGVDNIVKAFDGNVFTDASKGLDTLTTATLDAAEAVRVASEKALKNNTDAVNSQKEKNAEIIAAEKQLAIDIQTIQTQSAAEQASFDAQLAAIGLETTLASDLAKIEAISNQKIAEAQAVYEGELLKNQAIKDADQRKLADEKAFQTLSLSSIKIAGQREVDEKQKINDAKKKSDADYKANLSSTLDQISTLQTSGNKALIAVGKVAALAQLQISGSIAVGKALELGPIIGPPLAAAVAVSFAAQAAKVAGVAFESGGFINGAGGATNGPDNTIASVRSGEMVLNANQQGKLFDMINAGGGGSAPIIIQIDGRTIATAVRDQIQGGFRLA